MRSWLRGEVSKHIFAHRYDYRSLWLRFSATMDGLEAGDADLDARIARAIAQTVDAPAALLYLNEDGRFTRACAYGRPDDNEPLATLPEGQSSSSM